MHFDGEKQLGGRQNVAKELLKVNWRRQLVASSAEVSRCVRFQVIRLAHVIPLYVLRAVLAFALRY
jgi:hypothetical protein